MGKLKRIAMALLILLACIGCDQFSKDMAKRYLPKAKAISLAGDTLRLDYSENKGAVFSFEYFLPERWRGHASTAAVSFLLGAVTIHLLTSPAMPLLSATGLAMFSGGALSNLIDRVLLGGNVVDFLDMGWGWYRTGIFNLADAAVVVGLSLFACSLLRGFVSWISRRLSRSGTRSSPSGE